MPNVICAVVGCSNSTYRLKKWKKETCLEHHGFHECCGCPRPFHMFCFPSELQNNDQRQLWIQAMKKDNVKGNPWKTGDKQNSDVDFHSVDYDFHENEHIEAISNERQVDIFQHVVINEHSYCRATNTPNCADCQSKGELIKSMGHKLSYLT